MGSNPFEVRGFLSMLTGFFGGLLYTVILLYKKIRLIPTQLLLVTEAVSVSMSVVCLVLLLG